MKRFLLSTVIALIALCASAAIGDTFSVGKLNYQVTSNGTTEDYPQVVVTGLSAEGKAISSLNLQIQSTVLYNGTHRNWRLRILRSEKSCYVVGALGHYENQE